LIVKGGTLKREKRTKKHDFRQKGREERISQHEGQEPRAISSYSECKVREPQ